MSKIVKTNIFNLKERIEQENKTKPFSKDENTTIIQFPKNTKQTLENKCKIFYNCIEEIEQALNSQKPVEIRYRKIGQSGIGKEISKIKVIPYSFNNTNSKENENQENDYIILKMADMYKKEHKIILDLNKSQNSISSQSKKEKFNEYRFHNLYFSIQYFL